MTTTLPAGTYYVGDLCYVLDEDNGWDWDALLDDTGYLGFQDADGNPIPLHKRPTTFTFNGVTFFSSSTKFGDGSYLDNLGREYPVDSGGIGCVPVSAIGGSFDPQLGHAVTFDEPFECHGCDQDGYIRIGNLTIDTYGHEED